MPAPLFHRFNYAPLWSSSMAVWGGKLFHPSLDRWLYLTLHRFGVMGKFERRTLGQLIRPGMHVLDVGGNIGLYCWHFSQLVGSTGHVTTIEPDANLGDAIEWMIRANQLKHVELVRCAAGDREGSVEIHHDIFNSGNTTVAEAASGSGAVPERRLDSLSLPRVPDFIKIDIQGWEEKALLGLSGLLSADVKPVIYCEICESGMTAAGSSARRVAELLQRYGYRLFIPRDEASKVRFEEVNEQQVHDEAQRCAYFDLVAATTDLSAS